MMEVRKKEEKEEEKDRCVGVNCGVETPYTKDTHVDERLYYIEGAGQLCKKCWDSIFEKN